MYTLKVKHFFDASHQLPDTPDLITKQCARLHGHTYAVIVEILTNQLKDNGMVVDFKAVKDIIDILDHKHVNDVFKQFSFDKPPTAENIAFFIAYRIQKSLELPELRISVCEGYKGRERSSWATYSTI